VMRTFQDLIRGYARRRRPARREGHGGYPIIPVSLPLANALADATGVRFRYLSVTPDRIYCRIFERHVV
jgi:CO/xanthine dehydrogenase Mo-binding subunit